MYFQSSTPFLMLGRNTRPKTNQEWLLPRRDKVLLNMSKFTENSMCFHFWWSLILYVASLHTLDTCLFSLSQCSEPFSTATFAGRQFLQHPPSVLELHLIFPDVRAILNLPLQLSPTTFSFAPSKCFHHLKTVRMFITCRPQAFCHTSEVSLACFSQIQASFKKRIFSNIFYKVILTGAKMLSASVNWFSSGCRVKDAFD